MNLGLEGKVAVVTGAGRGIGRAVAHTLAGEGALVYATDIDKNSADATAGEIDAAGGRARALEIDVRDAASIEATIAAVLKNDGRIDVLVNNAGIIKVKSLAQSTIDDWEAVCATNLTGVLRCSLAAVRIMCEQRSGKIVNISSISSLKGGGVVGNAMYGMTKAAVTTMTKGFAKEYASFGINTNAVVPGPVDTAMTRVHIPSDEVRERMTGRIPVGRFGVPQDIADLVTFLASDRAAYMNGSAVLIDGGFMGT